MTKHEFIEYQLLTDSINAAFQRANVYADTKLSTDSNRAELREKLAKKLSEFAKQYSVATVSETQHSANINEIADHLSDEFRGRGLLRNDRFRIGIAQKAFNLYLKYQWCAGWIGTPPHCPFDSVIITKLPLSEKQKRDLCWTKLDSREGCQTLVIAAKKAAADAKHLSVAEWELAEWKP